MKEKLAVAKGRPLADYLPTVTIWGKGLATGITNHNMQSKNLEGTNQIAEEHITNNDAVRQLLISRGIVPEELPAAEDVKKVKRRLNSAGKKLIDKKKK
jgi:DNA-damage-inducible protein D